jgi:hypothetical protein
MTHSIGDGFRRHNIDHLSASSLNAAATQLPAWIAERLLGHKIPVGAAAHRGSAIEAGVTQGLLFPEYPVADCQSHAATQYSALTAFSLDTRREQEREAVTPTVAVALAELRQYGVPDMVQTRIEKTLYDGLPPLIGFLDYGWTATATVVDLKTSLRLASDISTAHGRQVAGYVHGTNHTGRICYATKAKCAVYIVDRIDERFNELVEIALRVDRFLGISSDPAELAAMLPVDADHFFWNNPEASRIRREVYGY